MLNPDDVDEILRKKNVLGVGLGTKKTRGKDTGRICITVMVEKKVSLAALSKDDIIPNTVGPIPTDVIETGKIKALSPKKKKDMTVIEEKTEKTRMEEWRPSPCGVSCGHKDVTAGTQGAVVETNNDDIRVLTNNHVGANCFDSKTEVLTEKGWSEWESIEQDTKLATRNYKGELIYQKPDRLIRQLYNGIMVGFKGMWHNLLVTPNHRLIAKKSYKGGVPRHMLKNTDYLIFKRFPVKDVLERMKGKQATFEQTCKAVWNCNSDIKSINIGSKNIKIEPFLEFLGLYLSDGSTTIRDKVHQYIVQIRTTKDDVKKIVTSLARKMGYHSFINGDAVRITNKELATFLIKLGKTKTKRIPREYLNLHPNQLRHLWKGLVLGDGHYYEKKGYYKFILSNKELVDDIQELVIKLGMGASIRKQFGSTFNPKGIYWCLTTHRTKFKQYKKPEFVKYKGMIYSAQVPNGSLLVRRNGHPVWSGNSNDAEIEDEWLQPGPYDGGDIDDYWCVLDWFEPIKFGGVDSTCPFGNFATKFLNDVYKFFGRKSRFRAYSEEYPSNTVDMCLGKPVADGMIEPLQLEIGNVTGINTNLNIGDRVMKSGRTTGVTYGDVMLLSGIVQVEYGPGKVGLFIDQLVTSYMVNGGDSGSLTLDNYRRATGEVFAGSDMVSIHNNIDNIINTGNIKRFL